MREPRQRFGGFVAWVNERRKGSTRYPKRRTDRQRQSRLLLHEQRRASPARDSKVPADSAFLRLKHLPRAALRGQKGADKQRNEKGIKLAESHYGHCHS